MDTWLWLGITVAVVTAFAVLRHRRKGRASIAVTAPKVCFLSFDSDRFSSLVAEDRTALGASFSQTVDSANGEIPTCDVLFVYAQLSPDGSLVGAPEPTIRHVSARARAAMVVLASPNSGESIVAASKLPGPKNASLVFTIDRRDGFTNFFRQLFSLMAAGKPMPLAWVTLAPQHANAMLPGIPETIFVPEAGAVTFQ